MQRRFWIIVGAGVLLLVVAALLSAFQGWGDALSTALVAGGGALWTLAVVLSWRDLERYLRRRSARYGLNAFVLSFLVAVILFLLGFIASRHGARLDLTANHEYSLSDKTLKVLQGIQRRIDIHVFYDRQEREGVRDLLREYTRRNGLLRLHLDDLNKDPETAERFGVTSLGNIVFDAGDKVERITAISEEDVTNALIKVSRPGKKKIYFITDHGEKDIVNKGIMGYAAAAEALRRENYEVLTLSLGKTREVPADCDVLVLAGAKSRFLETELLAVQRFVERGRRLLALFDPRFQCGLEDYLLAWGIRVGNDRVVDASPTGQLFGRGASTPLVNHYGVHPITKQFRLPTYFELVRSVGPFQGYGGGAETAVLAYTSDQSWADGDITSTAVSAGDPDDIAGPVPVAMAVKLDVAGLHPELESAIRTPKPGDASSTADALQAAGATTDTEARIVVCGDSDFANNRNFADMGNGNLFLNCIAWLAQDEDLIAVRPKDPDLRHVALTQAQIAALNIVAVGLLPALVAALGIVVTLRRRARS
jgi:ABC-type uncharacterized transport system involved in gliding motility auxiliary subunit